jgi:hypothetical protein
MPIYTKLRYITNGEGYVSKHLTINKDYKCIGIHKTSYIIRDDENNMVFISGRMRKRFFKGII